MLGIHRREREDRRVSWECQIYTTLLRENLVERAQSLSQISLSSAGSAVTVYAIIQRRGRKDREASGN